MCDILIRDIWRGLVFERKGKRGTSSLEACETYLMVLSPFFAANVEYIVATTKLINGNSFLQSLTEPLGRDYSLQ